MGRRKKEPSLQAELGAPQPAVRTSEPAPSRVVEYQPLATEGLWRVNRWEALCAELDCGLTVEHLPLVHEALRPSARSWMLVRKFFGFGPVKVSLSADPNDYRTWTREEICAEFGIDKDQFQAELQGAAVLVKRALGGETGKLEAVVKGELRDRLVETDDEVLKRYHFPLRMFEVIVHNPKPGGEPLPRSREENNAEKAWFVGRVRQFEKLLQDPMAGRLADQLLRNELRLKRAEDALVVQLLGSEEEKKLITLKIELEKTIERQLKDLKEVAPWFSTTEKRLNARGALSDIIKGIRDYRARRDTALIDGLHTSYELQVLVRTSKQKPEPDYRLGLNCYIMDSRAGIFDPNWKSRFREKDLRRLDAGFKGAVAEYVEQSGEHVPDLKAEGPEGEHEDIFIPEEDSSPEGPHSVPEEA